LKHLKLSHRNCFLVLGPLLVVQDTGFAWLLTPKSAGFALAKEACSSSRLKIFQLPLSEFTRYLIRFAGCTDHHL